MSTIMLDISEVHSPACASTISIVASMGNPDNLTSQALHKMSCCSEVPSPLFYTMDLTWSSISYTSTSISCSEALSLKTLYSLSTSLDIDKPYNRQPVDCTYSPEAHSSVCPSTKSAKVSKSPTEIDMYESPSQLAFALINSPALPKPRTITMMSLQYEDPASKWHKMESVIRMPPLLYASARLYALYKTALASKWPELCLAKPRSIYKVISASELHKICLAVPRSFYKTSSKTDVPKTSSKTDVLKTSSKTDVLKTFSKTDVLKTSSSKADVFKLSRKRYETKTPSKADVIKRSSSLCHKHPRLQYLRYKKSHPREGITRHSATSGQLPACRP